MMNDEVVDEVRAIREGHAAKFGYDLRAIYEDIKRSEAEHIAAGHAAISSLQTVVVPPSLAGNAERFIR